jgi:hypothetical protein
MADLKSLLAELGGDSPQNRSIAEGLQKQGISSTKDIGVRKVPVAGRWEGTDEASYYVPETTENAYFNKTTGDAINPTRLGVYQVDKDGKAQGDIFFHLNADDQGNVKFDPQWSPRAHGFLRDNAVGQLIMKAGAVIPNPFQAAFVAANVGDALAHEKYGKALLAAAPYGFQQLGGMDALKGALGFGPSGLDMGDVIPQGGIADYLPSGLDMGDVIPQGGIAEYLPVNFSQADKVFEQLVNPASNLSTDTLDQFVSKLTQPSLEDLTATNASYDLPVDLAENPFAIVDDFASPSSIANQVPEADRFFENIMDQQGLSKGLDIYDNQFTTGTVGTPGELPVNWSESILSPNDVKSAINSAAGLDINDNAFTTGTVGKIGELPVNWSETETALERLTNPQSFENASKVSAGLDINDNTFTTGTPGEPGVLPVNWGADVASTIKDVVGSDWSAGTPTTELTGTPPADLTTKVDNTGVDANGNSKVDLAGTKVDLSGNKITDNLTLDKVLDLGGAYLGNPAALAGLIGTGLAATNLVDKVINPNPTTTGNITTLTTSPLPTLTTEQIISLGPTTGLQDLFDYGNLYKNTKFATQPIAQLTPPTYPAFTVSDIFRDFLKAAPDRPKIEPNLVGLAGLQQKMTEGK